METFTGSVAERPQAWRRQAHNFELDLLEFEMALDSVQPALNGFAQSVREAARTLDGAYLFDLPASGLVPGCQRIAAVHLPITPAGRIVFALLSEDGVSVTVSMPSEDTADLARFAEAFVTLHSNLAGSRAD